MAEPPLVQVDQAVLRQVRDRPHRAVALEYCGEQTGRMISGASFQLSYSVQLPSP